jgi:hypothetical protein
MACSAAFERDRPSRFCRDATLSAPDTNSFSLATRVIKSKAAMNRRTPKPAAITALSGWD